MHKYINTSPRKIKRPTAGISVIILNKDRVLLGKRKGNHGAGTWCFPGGHLEYFETLRVGAIREVKEETGLDIGLIDEYPVATANNIFREEGKHTVTLFLRAKYLRGEPKIMEPDKCEKWEWFKWDNFPSPLFVPLNELKKQNYNPFK